jgi:MYXO-CTERM domain-containing protein
MKLVPSIAGCSIAATLVLFGASAAAAPTVYTSRTTFDAAFPGLGIETFQGLTASAGCPSPLSSASAKNSCFEQGTLRAGFSVGGVESHPTDGVVLTPGPTGHFIATSYYSDTTVLDLSPAQLVVGFDMQLVGGGGVLLTNGTTATITAYDGSSNVIATQDVASGGFFGVRSDVPVAFVKVNRTGIFSEGIDNLAFGPAFSSVSPPTGGYRGGSTVTLTGEGLAAGTTVTFDGVPATDVVVSGGTSLTCKAPAHAEGTVDVVLQTSGVTLTRASSFTYVAHTASIALSVVPKSPRYDGETNAFTATVTGTAPTGSVELFEESTKLTQGALANGSVELVTALGVGTHHLFARYEGDPFHPEAESSEVTVEVEMRPPPPLDAGLDAATDDPDAGLDAGDDAAANASDAAADSSAPGAPTTDDASASSDGNGADASSGGNAAGASSDGDDTGDDSGCTASREAPRAPFGAAALMLFAVFAWGRRRKYGPGR